MWVVVCSFFFFKQKTAYEMRISDWSSDVCSSDLSLAIRSMDSDNADAVPASGISGQVSANQINSVDGSQITGVVSRAASADTASTAQSLDPNAKLNLPVDRKSTRLNSSH